MSQPDDPQFWELILNLFSILKTRNLEKTVADERVVAVAAKIGELIVTLPSPARHHDLMMKIFHSTDWMIAAEQQGYLTSYGRFVSRREARDIAVEAG